MDEEKSEIILYTSVDGKAKVSSVEISAERYEDFEATRKHEEARLADEADLEELRRIEEEVKRRNDCSGGERQ